MSHQPYSVELSEISLHLPIRYQTGATTAKETWATVGGGIWQSRRRRYVEALAGINLNVVAGERIAVFGHNGAGKTSLLRVVSGIYRPTSGQRLVHGRVSAMFSSSIGLDQNATGTENIRFACALYGVNPSRVEELIVDIREFTELGDYLDCPIQIYSSGMRTRLGFAIVTSVDADVLIVDEVLSAGDLAFTEKAKSRVLAFIERSKVLIMASHSPALMRSFCTRAVWLDHGRIKKDGPFEPIWMEYAESRKSVRA